MSDFGEIIFTLDHRDMARTVMRADPVALISTEFLNALYEALIDDGPTNDFMYMSMNIYDFMYMSMNNVNEPCCAGSHPVSRCYHGALIYITPTDDRKYIYRIGLYNWEHNAWEARWVD
jgi:hypothetical protein